MDPWAQLVSTTDIDSDPIAISKHKFVIGRAQGVDLCLLNNKMVSGVHCFIERDSSGNVWLQDSSTNGTLLNQRTKVSGKRVALSHGDEIFIVSRKAEADQNVSFLFQVLEDLHREQLETTDEGSIELDQTQPYEEDFTQPSLVRCITADRKDGDDLKRKLTSSKIDDSKDEPAAKKSKHPADGDGVGIAAGSANSPEKQHQEEEIKPTPVNNAIDTNVIKEETPGDEKLNDDRQPLDPKSVEGHSGSGGQPGNSDRSDDLSSFMENELICSICQDILHNSISLQPCLHTFCAGCYSDWMNKSRSCPWCRRRVKLISKNHKTNNIVEAYLKAHPDKRRSDDDLKELDEKNRITKEMMAPLDPQNPIEYDDDEEEEEEEDDADEDEVDGQNDAELPPAPVVPNFPALLNVFPGFRFPLGLLRPAKTVCRQCPEYLNRRPADDPKKAGTTATGGDAHDNGPVGACACGGACAPGACALGGTLASTSGAKKCPVAPHFTCEENQNHIMCQCCWEPMPHRKSGENDRSTIPPQECALCHKAYCHMYWGCRAACNGCLNRFEETVFHSPVLDSVVLNNKFESNGLKAYLESRGLSVQNFFSMCVYRLKSGMYTCSGQDLLLHPNSAVCYNCALDKFSELAYQFRRDVQNDMPDVYKLRTNCHWGRNCKTQKTNEGHAQRFNHICEASRTDVRP